MIVTRKLTRTLYNDRCINEGYCIGCVMDMLHERFARWRRQGQIK